ncbi:hypothetical protein QR685DRAFT_530351, partial [Neurospora intermedia]
MPNCTLQSCHCIRTLFFLFFFFLFLCPFHPNSRAATMTLIISTSILFLGDSDILRMEQCHGVVVNAYHAAV